MEQTTIPNENIQVDKLTVGQPQPKLGEETATITGYGFKEVMAKNKATKMLEIIINHSERPDLRITKVKIEGNNGKLESIGLWVNIDKEGKLLNGSAIHKLLQHLAVTTIQDIVGKQVRLVYDDQKYLIIKAY